MTRDYQVCQACQYADPAGARFYLVSSILRVPPAFTTNVGWNPTDCRHQVEPGASEVAFTSEAYI
ncbi:MAG: hypothetical protein WCR52_15255 [Bacteroidota bacterium]